MTQRSRGVAARRAALLISIALTTMASPAFAQESDETPQGATPENPGETDAISAANDAIVITATKKANVENVQDVPIAVTAFGEESLEALKVRDVTDLTYSAPNVSLDEVGTSRGSANFSIRGLGVNSSIPSIDPTVGLFIDGVYLGVNSGVVFDIFDLDSVELLRGPQGILFGRNTTGGAVLLNTGNPTDDYRMSFRVGIDGPVDGGRGGPNVTSQGVVSGPLIRDTLNFKLAAYHNYDDGYFTNLFTGRNFGKADTSILRAGLELDVFDGLTLLAKGEYFTSDGDGPAAQNHGRFERDTFDFAIDNEGSYSSTVYFGTLRADLDVGANGLITNIFGYRDASGATDGDIDSLPAFLFHSDTEFEQEQYSNELRYAGEFGFMDLTVGGYYFHQDIAYTEVRDLPPLSPLTFYGGGTQDHDVLGVFAQGDFNITDALTLIAGLRWSREDKADAITYIRPRPMCSVVDGTCPTSGTNPFIPSENNGFSDDNSWSNFSPKLGLQYRFSPTAQAYATWTRGYRSGGYNFRLTNPSVFENIVVPSRGGDLFFDEERVDSFDTGVKYQTPDRNGTLNLAAYYTRVKDMQREVNQSSPTAGVSQFILNTADADIKGFEAEGRYALTDSLLLSANLGYIDADYDEIFFDISGDGVIDDADLDLKLPRVPKLTYGVGLLYDLDLGSSSVVTRVNYQHRDRFAYTDSNFGYITESDNLDANITWNTPYPGLALSIYGKNLLDEVQHGGDTQIPFGGPLSDGDNMPFDPFPAAGTLSPLNKGRQVGVELSFEI